MLLNKEQHYTDVIAVDIQQTIEKAFKAIYAFNGDKIPRTHSLEILFNYCQQSSCNRSCGLSILNQYSMKLLRSPNAGA